MQTSRALSLVHDHRRRIEWQLAESVAFVSTDPIVAREPLARARWTMVQLLREYQLFKQIEIFEPAIRSGSRQQALAAAQLQRACAAAWHRYCGYTLDWSACDIAGCWSVYRPAMLEMAGAIRAHVLREEQALHDLLAAARRTRHLNEAAGQAAMA